MMVLPFTGRRRGAFGGGRDKESNFKHAEFRCPAQTANGITDPGLRSRSALAPTDLGVLNLDCNRSQGSR